MTTIKDIARIAKVSKSTVSRVVSNKGFVKDETKRKIEQVIKEVNYKPNLFAKGMRTNKSNTIGILFPELSNSYFSEWYEYVDKISREHDYLNYICITDPKGETEIKRIDDLLARNIDGIIMFTYCKRIEVVEKLLKVSRHTPVICCDAMMDDTGLYCISGNGEKGTYEAVDYLIKSGRNRIAYITGRQPFEVVERRYKGYIDALTDNNKKPDKSLQYQSVFKRECGFKAAEIFMSLNNPPDAIVSSTDEMAIGVIDYLTQHKVEIPKQVTVIGFNNQEISKHPNAWLSTVAWPIEELATTTIKTLIKNIETSNYKPIKKVLDCQLILRES